MTTLNFLDDVDPKVWVTYSFDRVEDGPGGEQRGRLIVQFNTLDSEYIHFTLHPVEYWISRGVMIRFKTGWSEELSDGGMAEVQRADQQAETRIVSLHQPAHQDRGQWLADYDEIVETLTSFDYRITCDHHEPRQMRIREPNDLPISVAGSRVFTLQHTPMLEIWATKEQWNQLHDRVQRMPDIPELGATLVTDSFTQITEGMVRAFGDGQAGRNAGGAMPPFRMSHCGGLLRLFPGWIEDIFDRGNME
ncbi:hypothetical protein EsH8_II_000266 [Colletotrichum jinshuiense]